MNLLLFDEPDIRRQLLPFTYIRPLAEIRVGIMTITEKWEAALGLKASFITERYLEDKFPAKFTLDNLLINGALCPDKDLVKVIESLTMGSHLVSDGRMLVARTNESMTFDNLQEDSKEITYHKPITFIAHPWDIFKKNGAEIRNDFKIITSGRESALITDQHTIVYCQENIFLEQGVTIKAAILNAEKGPIYLGKDSSVEEGTLIRGPFSLGNNATINAHARMRGDITIGPRCKVGGEVNNAVMFGHSNKGHDGFLGNSVIGEWCNIGADTNTSNLKNNYDKVKVWDYGEERFLDTDEQFCGLFMGDHSKSAISTMFNTGTSVGIAANIFGPGFPRTFIPSFSWGGAAGFTTFNLEKVNIMAEIAMKRRNGDYTNQDRSIMKAIYNMTKKFRVWEKDV